MRYNEAAVRTAYLAVFHAAQALISESSVWLGPAGRSAFCGLWDI
jgi:hypothetical protein